MLSALLSSKNTLLKFTSLPNRLAASIVASTQLRLSKPGISSVGRVPPRVGRHRASAFPAGAKACGGVAMTDHHTAILEGRETYAEARRALDEEERQLRADAE